MTTSSGESLRHLVWRHAAQVDATISATPSKDPDVDVSRTEGDGDDEGRDRDQAMFTEALSSVCACQVFTRRDVRPPLQRFDARSVSAIAARGRARASVTFLELSA